MLHISTFGTRIFQTPMAVEDFLTQWRTANTNTPGYGLLDIDTDAGRVFIPTAAVSSVVVD